MFRNYLKLAWRNLLKRKAFSAINIFGLAIGLTCCMLIALYIYNELSFDKHHAAADRVFQLGTVFIDEGVERRGANSSAPLGRMLQETYPEIEATARMMRLWRDDKTLFQVKNNSGTLQSFYETKGFLADSSLFEVLSFPFAEGNPRTALLAPNSVVISQALARRLFGNGPAHPGK